MAVASQQASDVGLDARLFRHALGQFPTGVCIVAAVVDGERVGMTMSSFNSVSLDPPLVLFSVDRRAASLGLLERTSSCVVNVLAENQKEISSRFARPRWNKWEGIRTAPRSLEATILTGTAAVFECVPWNKHDAGDHRLFIVEVKRFTFEIDRMPLVFCKGRYASLQPTDVPAPLWPLDIHY